MDRFVIGGMKHCGKSTHGRLLAAGRELPFFDTDEELEQFYATRTGDALTTREIYRKIGEEEFRKLEAEVVTQRLTQSGGRVVALGGGAPGNRFIDPALWEHSGCFIYLEIDPEEAFRRVKAGGLPPFLAGAEDPHGEFMRLYRDREQFYRRYADVIFRAQENVSAAENAAALAKEVEDYEQQLR